MLKYGTEQNNHETIDELEETQRSQEQNLIINTTKSSWRKLVVLSTCDCFVWKNFLLPGWDILIIDTDYVAELNCLMLSLTALRVTSDGIIITIEI